MVNFQKVKTYSCQISLVHPQPKLHKMKRGFKIAIKVILLLQRNIIMQYHDVSSYASLLIGFNHIKSIQLINKLARRKVVYSLFLNLWVKFITRTYFYRSFCCIKQFVMVHTKYSWYLLNTYLRVRRNFRRLFPSFISRFLQFSEIQIERNDIYTLVYSMYQSILFSAARKYRKCIITYAQ